MDQIIDFSNFKTQYDYTKDIDSFQDLIKEIDISEFMKVGEQYVEKCRWFFSVLIKSTASHGYATKTFDNDIGKQIAFVASNAYFFLNSDSANKECVDFFDKATYESGSGFWNIQDTNPIIRTFTYLSLPLINVSHVFNIPAESKEFYEERQKEILMKIQQNILSKQETEEKIECENDSPISLDEYSDSYLKIYESLQNLKMEKISLRLISNSEVYLPKSDDTQKSKIKFERSSSLINILKSDNEINSKGGCIHFHMHGGGFVATSTFSHECYLRQWAIKTNIPIISVEYTKAPEKQFPIQIEECYQAYKWMLKNGETIIKSPIKHITISGDSAGGNLCSIITMMSLFDGIRIPDAVVLSYPAMYMHSSPSPSRYLSLIDPMLNYGLVKICMEAYILDPKEGRTNPFLSPGIAPDEIVKKFPTCYINVGTLDPLLDDTIYFAKRLSKLTGKVKLEVYDGLSHGYLNLLDHVPEANDACNNVINWINEQSKF